MPGPKDDCAWPRLASPPAQDGLLPGRCRQRAWIGRLLTATALVLGPVAPALAGRHVIIIGGADVSGHNYEWTVTHDYDSPIVSLEFPHYMADAFGTPDGWTQKITNLLGGRKGRPGICLAESAEGLPAGQSAVFRLRIGPRGTPRGEGDVVVRFADGSEELVRAELPVRESFLGQHTSLIGLGAIFVLLLIRTLSKGRQRPAASTDRT